MTEEQKLYVKEMLVKYRQGVITRVEVKNVVSQLGYSIDVDKCQIKDGKGKVVYYV